MTHALRFAFLLLVPLPATSALAPAQKPDAKPAAKELAKEEAVELPTVRVGVDAPALPIAKWVVGGPIEKLEKGRVYLVSTWGASRLMVDDVHAPLTKLQKDHRAAGLVVIATACDGIVPGSAGLERYAEEHAAEIGFALGYEKDSLVDKHWREAAQQVFAPNYFLVDKQGKIAWIGELDDLEPTLTQVLAGKHDLAKAAVAYEAEIRFQLRTRKLTTALAAAEVMENWEKVIETAKKLIELEPVRLGGYAYTVMITLGVRLEQPDEAYAFAKAFLEGPAKDNVAGLNGIAWSIVDPEEYVKPRDLALAERAAKRAVELTKESEPSAMDTLALVCAHQAKWDEAIAWAKKCAKLDEGFASRVQWLEAERAKPKK